MDIAERLGVKLVMKYPIKISRIYVLYLFLKENPLEMEKASKSRPIYKVFDKKAQWTILVDYRQLSREFWDNMPTEFI